MNIQPAAAARISRHSSKAGIARLLPSCRIKQPVVTLHKAKVIAARLQMLGCHRAAAIRQGPEQRQAAAQQHGNAGDGDLVEQLRIDEGLDQLAAIDIGRAHAAGGQMAAECRQAALPQLCGDRRASGQGAPLAGHHIDRLVIWPGAKAQHGLKGLAPHQDHIDPGHVLRITAVFPLRHSGMGGIEPVQAAIGFGDKTVEAGGDKAAALHGDVLVKIHWLSLEF